MIRLVGVAEFKAALLGTVRAEQVATRQAVAKAAHMIEAEAKELLTETSHPRGTLTPSLPGQPPSLVSGNLRRSVTVKGPTPVVLTGFPGWKAQVGPTAIYGRIQELGGQAGYAMLPPRPYLEPAYELVKPHLRDIFVTEWRKPLML